jgi:hypothetical protein
LIVIDERVVRSGEVGEKWLMCKTSFLGKNTGIRRIGYA